ncbi:MAG: Holliday junction resolvase-like protein [Candidatus Thermoplasmatota archaeon]
MDVPDGAVLAVFFLLLASWVLAVWALRRLAATRKEKRSQSAKYGNLTEQFAPWMRSWPFSSPEGFRFLGKPIDGVQFERDAVYFVEIKAAGSQLSADQRAIRDAVLSGRVGWVTFRIADGEKPDVKRPWERA